MTAVNTNDLDKLKQCIAALGPNGLRNEEGVSLLEMSCEKGHEGCIRVLVASGCDPNKVTNHDSPLHRCAKHGHLQ